ncbi:hypothetical protein HN51_035215 [Arachis hypogaea]
MSNLIRFWMARTVAGTQSNSHSLNSKHNQMRFLFAGESPAPELVPIGNETNSLRVGQADDSLRKVMYLNIWGLG